MQPFATGLFLHWESDKRNKFLPLDVSIKSDPKALQRFTGRYFSLVQTEIAIVCLATAAGLQVILFHKAQKNLYFNFLKIVNNFLRRAERQARLLVITSVSDLCPHLVFLFV